MSTFEEKIASQFGPKTVSVLADALSRVGQSDLDGIFWKGIQNCDSNAYSAFQFFEVAAKKGHHLSQTMVALCLVLGHGCRRDHQAAQQWLGMAANEGEDVAVQIVSLARLFDDVDHLLEESNKALAKTKEFLGKSTDEQLDEILGPNWRNFGIESEEGNEQES